jgi:predicted pyridoxine 5'-phosphate oxidase superfamily flavin-nucleotide-binding protein
MIELTDQMRDLIARALDDKLPVIATSVDSDGQPTIAFYGSTQVHSVEQLAIWVRNPNAGLLGRLGENPRMAFMYRNPPEQIGWLFHGRARRLDVGEESQRVYDNAHQLEKDRDPDQGGVAVVIDVDRVIARGEVLMER